MLNSCNFSSTYSRIGTTSFAPAKLPCTNLPSPPPFPGNFANVSLSSGRRSAAKSGDAPNVKTIVSSSVLLSSASRVEVLELRSCFATVLVMVMSLPSISTLASFICNNTLVFNNNTILATPHIFYPLGPKNDQIDSICPSPPSTSLHQYFF
jgi:hypothetical protein